MTFKGKNTQTKDTKLSQLIVKHWQSKCCFYNSLMIVINQLLRMMICQSLTFTSSTVSILTENWSGMSGSLLRQMSGRWQKIPSGATLDEPRMTSPPIGPGPLTKMIKVMVRALVQWLWDETRNLKVVFSNPSTVYWMDIFHIYLL